MKVSTVLDALGWVCFVPIILIGPYMAVYILQEAGWGVPVRWSVIAGILFFAAAGVARWNNQ